jgi:hypothetical protein
MSFKRLTRLARRRALDELFARSNAAAASLPSEKLNHTPGSPAKICRPSKEGPSLPTRLSFIDN